MIRPGAPGAFSSARGANDDISALRRTRDRYRRLLRLVTDPGAIASLEQLLAETEQRLLRRARRSQGALAGADD